MEPFSIKKMLKILNFMGFEQVFVVIGGRSAYNRKELVAIPHGKGGIVCTAKKQLQ